VSRSIGLLLTSRWLRCSLFASTLLGAGLAAAIAGCKSTRDVAVRVSIPGPDALETPASGVGVVALPYDRDSVLASLQARASSPRPHTAEMDTLFARFRGPFIAYTTAAYAAGKLRDSLAELQAQLDSLGRGTPRYQTLHARFSRLSDSLASIEIRSKRAGAALSRARSDFVSRSESLRRAIRQWEDSTYRGWDSIVERLAKTRGLEPATDTTDATGWARFTLAPGKWWIYARAWDTSDPNSEWYWNVPVSGDTVLLSSRTGQQRPRY
jgi:hypothetical protein